MRTFKTLLPVIALTAGLALSASANAATLVSIGLSTDNGATITPVGVAGATSSNVSTLSFNGWEVTADAHVGFFPDLLNSNTFDAKAADAGTLDVFVTVQNLTALAPGFLTGFTENLLSAGWSVTETSYLSAANALWTGAQLSTMDFSAVGSGTGFNGLTAGPNAYSVTERFHIVANGQGNAQSTLDITAVPEPATWGLMIVGFGGIGSMVRSNRRRQATATA